jgi:hypothetical protein
MCCYIRIGIGCFRIACVTVNMLLTPWAYPSNYDPLGKSLVGQVLAVQPHPGLHGCDKRTERFPACAKNAR